jgi:hypothetical protein
MFLRRDTREARVQATIDPNALAGPRAQKPRWRPASSAGPRSALGWLDHPADPDELVDLTAARRAWARHKGMPGYGSGAALADHTGGQGSSERPLGRGGRA